MKTINLSQGKVAWVDDADYEWLNQWKWYTYKGKYTYYVARHTSRKDKPRKLILMHRFILNTPKGMDVDHRNHNGLDNQRHNIRTCTRRQNLCNKTPSSKSGFLGVRYVPVNNNYSATINVNKRRIFLGVFKTDTEAAIAYNKAAKIHHEGFANFNIIKV